MSLRLPSLRAAATAALLLGLASAPFALTQKQGDVLTVTRKTTKLRNAKRAFAPPVTDLAEGDKVVVVAKDGAWFQVAFTPLGAPDGTPPLAGFVHAGDVTASKDVRLSGQGVRENYSASEAAAARKGFNPEVERKHRENHPDLEAAFRQVDAIQARVVSEDEVAAFVAAGGLGGEVIK